MHCSFFELALCLWAWFKISAVFCGKKVILATQEKLSSLVLMHIHRVLHNDKVVPAKEIQFWSAKIWEIFMFFKTFVTQYQTTLFPPSPPRDLFLRSRSVRLLATGLQRARFTWKKKLPERPLSLQHYLSGLYSNFPRKRDVVNMQPIFFLSVFRCQIGCHCSNRSLRRPWKLGMRIATPYDSLASTLKTT